ncbi:putative hotdog family 3-hydroxylacyl-ACP dehydratase [Aquimarina sp. EL_43]|uniref:ABC transporter permease n=1 Tax=Aquimarina TaxID=290174 RepID=UPI00046E8DB4|nr:MULTISPECIES: ABC transporter permease [Aquimarina]MBG6130141.1 putative hotdog family 3-hydroxylacyl-ACP dehydratase [Aquimarina sp. EL_35]MBG6148921.1 putative hotdog family 3-hydroxylacyl-ACP dehydratase [Aquimarina sp. EL_32]MBG6168705.1 putative hotdog family 3-hydroxylacyl-ACP dehydratase [Aquimarina sp. EL_43]
MDKVKTLDIAKFLPHRTPFLMVDKVLSIDDEHVATSFTIKSDCIFVSDTIFNEIGMVENAAQTCSSIVGKSYFEDDDLEGEGTKLIGFISAIKKVQVYSCPTVGETIVSKAVLKSRFDTEQYSMCTLECTIHEADKELLSCEMNLFIQEMK